MKTVQALFDLQSGALSESDRETLKNELYHANRELLAFFRNEPKNEFKLTKEGKETRTVQATCRAEVEANPANKGWTITN